MSFPPPSDRDAAASNSGESPATSPFGPPQVNPAQVNPAQVNPAQVNPAPVGATTSAVVAPVASQPLSASTGAAPVPPPIHHLPRTGELTVSWRFATALLWIAAFTAFAAIWQASVQLGLTTWWLGPLGQMNPMYVRVVPFYAPVVMLILVVFNVRLVPIWGVVAAGVTIAIGLGDLASQPDFAYLEVAIGVGLAIASIVSLAGLLRRHASGPSGRLASQRASRRSSTNAG